VQTIDIAPTILDLANIPIPETYQGKSLTSILNQDGKAIRKYIFTENLWSNQFGNPRCEAVQNKKWKYIRYYHNNTFPASKKIASAIAFDIPVNKMLYKVHDEAIPIYRDYVEVPLLGEIAVYEELFDLKSDPQETNNLIYDNSLDRILNELKEACGNQLKLARGEHAPRVLRYTHDSEMERRLKISQSKN